MKQASNRILCILLAAILLLGTCPAAVFAAENTTDFLGGTGTADNPYLISNTIHLENVSQYPSSHFLLLADIDLAGEEFTPIQGNKGIFKGTFDGGGHTIYNAVIRSANNYRMGLFIENEGTIKNLRVENVDVYYYPSSSSYLGGIAGINRGTIENCYVSGIVDSSSTYENGYGYVGGIAGTNYGTIKGCFSRARVLSAVNKTGYTGGMAGRNYGRIENCANAGSIAGPCSWYNYRGGIAGYNDGVILDCLNTGYVGCETSLGRQMRFGGIAGYSVSDEKCGIFRCVNSGKVYYDLSETSLSGYCAYSGEIVGELGGELSMEDCYYMRTREYTAGVGNGADTAVGCTVSQFMDAATFGALDFQNTWMFTGDDHKYPVLKQFADIYRTVMEEDFVSFAGGKGTAWDPYRITTKQQLNNVRNFPDAYFLLMNDLTFTETDFLPGGEQNFEPIEEFSGSFDGGGRTISGLKLSVETTMSEERSTVSFYLFKSNSGSISNLTLSDVRIDISSTVPLAVQPHSGISGSGLVGRNSGQIINCHVSGSIGMRTELIYSKTYHYSYPSADTSAALLCGSNYGLIRGCSADGSITASLSGAIEYDGVWPDIYAAGICCTNYGTIEACRSNVDISVTTDQFVSAGDIANQSIHIYAAGIAGENGDSSYNKGYIRDCVSKGSITVNSKGFMEVGSSARGGIHNLTYAGGIVGCNNVGGQVSRCVSGISLTGEMDFSGKTYKYPKSSTLTMENYMGGVVGYNANAVSDCYCTPEITMTVSEDCNFGTENKSFYAGGVVGYSTSGGNVTNCYAAGSVTAIAGSLRAYAGGGAGGGTNHKNLYYLEGMVGGGFASSAPGTSLKAEQMVSMESFAGFDFENVWCFDTSEGYFYPRLQAELGALTEVEILGNPGVVTTVEGVMPDVSHIRVKLTYASGKVSTVSMDSGYLSALDLTQVGTQTVPVSIRGITAETALTVQVNAKSLQGISVVGDPLTYLAGFSQLTVGYRQLLLEYDNGTNEQIPLTLDMVVTDVDETLEGLQELTIAYGGLTTALPVNVYLPYAMEIYDMDKTVYVQGQSLELDNIWVLIRFACGENTFTEVYTIDQVDSVVYDHNATGEVTITASMGGASVSFQITVMPKVIKTIRLTQPEKLTYFTGEALDLTGGYLTYVYESEDNYSEQVPLTADMISGFDPNAVGFQSVTVTAPSYSGSFIVRVMERAVTGVELTTVPQNRVYGEGTQAPDVTGGVLTVTYDDGSQAQIAVTADMISGFDGNKAGNQTLTVTYKTFTVTYDVTVEHVYTVHITEPTCTEGGYTTHTCACGHSYTDQQTEALGHSWDEGTVTKEPTEQQEGLRTYTCTVCAEEKNESIPMLEHTHEFWPSVKEPSCTQGGYTKLVCACGENYVIQETAPLGHNWSQWQVTKEPDHLENGQKSRSCAACADVQTEVIDNNPFPDVQGGNQFKEYVLWCYYNEIVGGKKDGTFDGNGVVTRGQFILMLWRAAGKPEPEKFVAFPDVSENSSFYQAVCWAVEQGITNGQKDGTFGINNECTRGHVALFLYRFAGSPEIEGGYSFSDVTGGTYYKAVCWLAENEIASGQKDGTFGVANACKRYHTTKFLYLFMNLESTLMTGIDLSET